MNTAAKQSAISTVRWGRRDTTPVAAAVLIADTPVPKEAVYSDDAALETKNVDLRAPFRAGPRARRVGLRGYGGARAGLARGPLGELLDLHPARRARGAGDARGFRAVPRCGPHGDKDGECAAATTHRGLRVPVGGRLPAVRSSRERRCVLPSDAARELRGPGRGRARRGGASDVLPPVHALPAPERGCRSPPALVRRGICRAAQLDRGAREERAHRRSPQATCELAPLRLVDALLARDPRAEVPGLQRGRARDVLRAVVAARPSPDAREGQQRLRGADAAIRRTDRAGRRARGGVPRVVRD